MFPPYLEKHIETKNKIAKANSKAVSKTAGENGRLRLMDGGCKIGPVPEESPLDEGGDESRTARST